MIFEFPFPFFHYNRPCQLGIPPEFNRIPFLSHNKWNQMKALSITINSMRTNTCRSIHFLSMRTMLLRLQAKMSWFPIMSLRCRMLGVSFFFLCISLLKHRSITDNDNDLYAYAPSQRETAPSHLKVGA
jgi:hypothetical protein